MTTKIVVRLLASPNTLLGWAEHQAIVSDGCLRAAHPIDLVMDLPGRADVLSLHWADYNVETRVPVGPIDTTPGESRAFFRTGDQMVFIGPPATGLPPVTTKSPVLLRPPVGLLGAIG